jgi:hypothetical protein
MGETEDFGRQVLTSELWRRPAEASDVEFRAVYFMGYVHYVDIFNNRFIVGFCLLFDRTLMRWRIRGDQRYNYCRKERTPYELPLDQP